MNFSERASEREENVCELKNIFNIPIDTILVIGSVSSFLFFKQSKYVPIMERLKKINVICILNIVLLSKLWGSFMCTHIESVLI